LGANGAAARQATTESCEMEFPAETEEDEDKTMPQVSNQQRISKIMTATEIKVERTAESQVNDLAINDTQSENNALIME